MPKALLIYNPNAGRFPAIGVANKACEVLKSHGWTVQIQGTRDADHVEELAALAVRDKLDALIVAGGDGSIGRTIQSLRGSNTALAVLPTGTANVWARQLGLPKILPNNVQQVVENANLIAKSQPKSMDVGICNGTPFMLWNGIGFDAMIVQQSEQNRSHLKKYFSVPEYFFRALWTAHRWPGLDLNLSAGDTSGNIIKHEGTVQIAVITNIPLYAGGLATISPDARINDGEMDLWLFAGQGVGSVLKHVWNLLKGKHVNNPNTIRIPFSVLDITMNEVAVMHADGDPTPSSKAIHVEVAREDLKFLAPPTAPQGLFVI